MTHAWHSPPKARVERFEPQEGQLSEVLIGALMLVIDGCDWRQETASDRSRLEIEFESRSAACSHSSRCKILARSS